MDRRPFLAAVALAVAGCTGRDGGSTPTGTPARTTSKGSDGQTQAIGLGTIEYTVTNRDDRSYRLDVTMANAEGRVVQETTEPEFEPGESVASGSAGEPPDPGPYTLTFSVGSASAVHVWDVTECARVDLAVTIEPDGGISVERELCQN